MVRYGFVKRQNSRELSRKTFSNVSNTSPGHYQYNYCLSLLKEVIGTIIASSIGLYSLYCRRQRGDLIETYKILNGYYDINPTSFFTLSNTDTTRGHHRKLFKFRSRLLVRHNFFTNRVVNLWNSLPADVISAPTVALFKKNLDDLWRTTRYGHSQRPAA